RGEHFDSVFTLRDFDSGDSQESLFSKTMLSCSSIGLRNRSVLKANDGTEKFISANCARILPPGNECDKAGPIGIIMVFRDVTSFKNHEIGIVNEKNNFINILNHIPSLIWKSNQEGECDYVNKVWSEFTGKSMEQAAGSMWQNVIHPDDIGYYMKKFDEARFKRETYEIEARYLRWDGEFRWCLDRGSPYYEMDGTYTGYIGSIIDITPRKLAEKELLQSRTKYHSLFMNMHNGYVEFRLVFDKDGRPDDLRVIEINAAFARICSMTQEFMQGRLFTELFPNVRAIMEKVFLEYERTLSKGESLEIHEGYSAEADRWYDLSIYSPQKEHIVMLISDITHMKKVERRLKESALAAEAANNAKSEFLANMSHEIRTPINGMLGMIDLTLNSKLDEEQKDNLDIAKKCAMSLLNIINDILDFSKIEAGKLSIRNLDFSIYKLIEELVRTHAPRAEAKGLELFYSFSSSVPEYLKGDPSRVRQILDNFASNAIKFTEKGKVNIEVKKTLEKENAVGLKFSVSDTGIGITSDDMSRLFKVFSQIDSSFTKKYSGTGLGLVISKQLAEIMGGGIEVESEPGKGSTFSLLMEFQPGTKPEDKPASAASG
ncbi:MAG: PAS domain S-box protein, partial [Clostridiales bacterium]|nr:PAS domain S-box protein [Clostridiales bacterium]